MPSPAPRIIVLGLLVVATAACKKTGEGEYQVEVPKLETETKTVRTPQIEVTKETSMVVTPKIEVKKPPRDTLRDTTSR